MVTINDQWLEQLVIGVSLTFPVNCTHTKNLAFESLNIQDSPEFNADVQAVVSAYEYTFKTSPDYSVEDLNLNVATWEVLMFESGVGVVSLSFTVTNAEITLEQYYGFPYEMSTEDKQTSLETQVQQYEINYKIGYNLTEL